VETVLRGCQLSSHDHLNKSAYLLKVSAKLALQQLGVFVEQDKLKIVQH
jgi:hypothetical protein